MRLIAQNPLENKLALSIIAARSDSEKVILMGELSRFYYANKSFDKADSTFEREIMLAESTLNPRLVLDAYFKNTAFLVAAAETKERSKSIRGYIKRALDFAKANEMNEYVSLAYAHLAAVDLADGLPDEAFRNANLAFTTSLNSANDSIQVIAAIQLGKVYQDKSDILMAYKVFTNAQNLALRSGNELLLPPVYHAMATLYRKFDKGYEAKKYIIQSLAINSKFHHIVGEINDNIFLAKLSNYIAGKEYLRRAMFLADSVNNLPLKLETEKILFAHLLVKEKPEVPLAFLDQRPELKNVFINTGPNYLDWMIAEVYLYGGVPDSALYYFKKAEPAFNSGYDLSTKKNFFEELASYFQSQNDVGAALTYYLQTFELAKASADLRRLQNTSAELSKLFEQKGDYKQAYNYGLLYARYKDSVNQLGKERDLALLEIDNVKKQQERDALLAKQKLERKYNLQYMLITIVVAAVFVLLIMIGMFKVSTTMIRIMGFLSLIFFFEFVILILDNWIHHLTHGEPWKVWLIKIGIISILLPVHHFLEHKLIHYLLSRHLITVRSKLAGSNLFKRKKIVLKIEEDLSAEKESPKV